MLRRENPAAEHGIAEIDALPAAPSAYLAKRVGPVLATTTAAWLAMGALNIAQGRSPLAFVDVAVSIAGAITFVGLLLRPSAARIAAHLSVAASVIGIAAIAALTGRGRATSIWQLAVVPMVSAYLFGVRGTLAWTGVCLLSLGAIERSQPLWAWLGLPDGPELAEASHAPRVAVLLVMAAVVAIAVHRVHREQVVLLRQREEVILKLYDTLSKQKEEVVAARDAAVEASRAKGDFLAVVSHEIRTPLNGILGLTGVMLDAPLPAEQKEMLRTIRSSGDALLGLLNDILDFSKIEAGRLTLEIAPFDLTELIEDALDLFGAAAAERGIDLALWIAPEVPLRVEGDGGRIRQILVNLLSNGVKFTLRGGVRIEVAVEQEPADEGRIVLRFSVVDTGIGIPEEHLPKLFQPFSQVDPSTTRKFGGTGLGLAICATLAERMDGRVWAESERGVGSTFHATAAVRSAPGLVDLARTLVDRRVVVVSDAEGTRVAATQALAHAGAVVDAFRTWAEAARAATPDVWVVDEDTARRLPEAFRSGLTGRPWIVLSGKREARGQALSAGASAVVPIPVRRGTLRRAVGRALGAAELEPGSSSLSRVEESPQLRVLVAEDNPVNQQVVRLLLTRMGHRVEMVGNGIEAVDAVKRHEFDVVLMDVHMPELDGIEATRQIRSEIPPARQPRIVAFTADATLEDRQAWEGAGMDGVIVKPASARNLARALRSSHPPPAAQTPAPGAATSASPPAAADAGPALRVLDAATLGTLRTLTANDPSMFRQIVDEYLQSSAAHLAAVRAALETGDLPSVRRAAHALKGSSGQVGAKELMDRCAALEQAAIAGDLGKTRGEVAPVSEEHARVEIALREARDETRP